MAAVRVPLSNHLGSVEVDAVEGNVDLDLDVEGDTRVQLVLEPDEARALAAVLVHQAGEIEAGRA